MKQKLHMFLLLLAVSVLLMLSLSSCLGGPCQEGHYYLSYVVVSEPTCVSNGLKELPCGRCEQKLSEEIPATGIHEYVDGACTMCGEAWTASLKLEYTLSSDGTYYIVTGIGTEESIDIMIASEINDKPVKEIGESAFESKNEIRSIIIPDSVTVIGNSAFRYCRDLASITIGSGVTTIGESAFGSVGGGVGGVAEIVLPNGLLSIGARAFSGFDGTAFVIPDSVKTIGERAFWSSSRLESVTIGSGVEEIGSDAFDSCTGLKRVSYTGTIDAWAQIAFADSGANPLRNAKHLYINDVEVTEVNLTTAEKVTKYAFAFCEGITSVIFGDTVLTIEDYAFRDCTALTTVTVGPNTATTKAFDDCTALNRVNYTGTIDQWAEKPQNGYTGREILSQAEHLYIDGVEVTDVKLTVATEIAFAAFIHCKSIKSVTMGDSVKSIGDLSFYDCSNLESVTIGDGVEYIGTIEFMSVFENCPSLTFMMLGSGLKQVYGMPSKNPTANQTGSPKLTKIYYKGTKEAYRRISFTGLGFAQVYFYAPTSTPTEPAGYWRYNDKGELVDWVRE